jgi:hypothetical protein
VKDGFLPLKKALPAPGPLERLFGGPPAAVLDFFMLVAHKGQYYTEAEVAGYAGLPQAKAKSALRSLYELGLLQAGDGQQQQRRQQQQGRKKKKKEKEETYALAESSIMGSLEKLALALTDREVKGSTSTASSEQFTGAGDTVAELVEKGILQINDDAQR